MALARRRQAATAARTRTTPQWVAPAGIAAGVQRGCGWEGGVAMDAAVWAPAPSTAWGPPPISAATRGVSPRRSWAASGGRPRGNMLQRMLSCQSRYVARVLSGESVARCLLTIKGCPPLFVSCRYSQAAGLPSVTWE